MLDEKGEELSGAEVDALLEAEGAETATESTTSPPAESSVAEIIASLNDDATVADIEAKVAAGELSTKDLARGFLREADYTRKTQTAAEVRKAAEAEKAEAATAKAALDEREAGLAQDNADLYKYLLKQHEDDPDMTLKQLLEDDAVDNEDEGQTGDEATEKRLKTMETKIDSRAAADFERDCLREIDVALDAVPDLVPSSKDTKEERQKARADLAESIYEHFLLKRADDKSLTLADVAKDKLAVERDKQKDRLTLLAEHHKTTKALGRREGAAGGATEAPPPLDLDTLSVGDAQDAGIERAMAKADAQRADE